MKTISSIAEGVSEAPISIEEPMQTDEATPAAPTEEEATAMETQAEVNVAVMKANVSII